MQVAFFSFCDSMLAAISKKRQARESRPADVLELYFFNADDVVLTDNDLSSLPDCPVEVDF